MKKAILLIILFMTFLMVSNGQPGKRFKLSFNEKFSAVRVNQTSEVKYIKLTNVPNKGEDPKEVPIIEILYEELIELNKDSPFHFVTDTAVKGYNSIDEQIFDSNNWDTLQIYPQGIETNKSITKLEIPIVFSPKDTESNQSYFKVPYKIQGYDNYLLDSIYIYGTGHIPSIEISNFTFEPQQINSGVSKQKGVFKILIDFYEQYRNRIKVNIKSIYIDPNSPDKELFTSFNVLHSQFEFEEFNGIVLFESQIYWVEFDLNTDMALTTGTKFARLVVESDAAPADENGELQYVENSYLHEFDGEFYKDNPTALNDGGYIQVEILENPQSSVEELTENDIKILNPQPITGSELNLELSEHQGTVITLSDIEGNVIQTLQAAKKQVSIDLSNLRSGVFFINISDGKSQITKKFMIER